MKKRIALGVGLVVLAGLAFYGRDLLDLYRLQHFIDASAQAYQADGGPWPHLTDACAACHGAQGNSLHQGYPSLAGQPSVYVSNQLRNFASGQRPSPNMRPLAMTLTDAEIRSLADDFARRTVLANTSFVPDHALQDKGRRLVSGGGCVACHGSGLMGHDQFPRLAGQGYDYLVAQLDAFASGARSEPSGVMKALAAAMSQDDRKAVATHLASLPPAAASSHLEQQ